MKTYTSRKGTRVGKSAYKSAVVYKPRSSGYTYKYRPSGAANLGGSLAYTAGALAYRYFRNRKRKQSLTRKIAVGNGSTKSSYTSGSARMPKKIWSMFQQNQKYTYSVVNSLILTNAVYGAQVPDYQVFAPSTLWTSDLARALGGVSPTNAQVSTSTLCYGTMKVTTTFTNVELTTTYLHIYEMEPRFHLSSAGNINPISIWDTGLNYEADTTNVVYSSNIYASPFKSHRFVDYYKVNKIISVELPAGGSHCHTSTYHLNRTLRGSVPLSYGSIRDFTKYHMYIASGSPLNDSVSSVSTSTIKLDIVTRREHDFTYDASYREKAQFETSLPTLNATVKVVTQDAVVTDGNA